MNRKEELIEGLSAKFVADLLDLHSTRRRCGSTTRAADYLIQKLFEHGKVNVVDPFYLANREEKSHVNLYLLNIIMKRLQLEHRGVKVRFYKGSIPLIVIEE